MLPRGSRFRLEASLDALDVDVDAASDEDDEDDEDATSRIDRFARASFVRPSVCLVGTNACECRTNALTVVTRRLLATRTNPFVGARAHRQSVERGKNKEERTRDRSIVRAITVRGGKERKDDAGTSR